MASSLKKKFPGYPLNNSPWITLGHAPTALGGAWPELWLVSVLVACIWRGRMADGASSRAWSCWEHPALLFPFSQGPRGWTRVLRGCSRSSSLPRAEWWHARGCGEGESGPRPAGTSYGWGKPSWHIFSAWGPLGSHMVHLIRAVNMKMPETALKVWSLGLFMALIVK